MATPGRGSGMQSTGKQVLELALALQKAPGERFRLRDRPLSPGIVDVLEIASGSAHALGSAAAELGEPEGRLLEAARFYLEQVLFAVPDADAYRILGVPPDAAQETIRGHHRWLQRWLHPDRAQAGDATVYATRVNQAWAQLRTPEARHAYDVRLAEVRLAGAPVPLAAATRRRWDPDETPSPRVGRRSRWLLSAALLSCAVLAVLVVRRPETVEPWQFPETSAPPPAQVHTAIADSDRGSPNEVLDPAPAPVVATRSVPLPPAAPSMPTLRSPPRAISADVVAPAKPVRVAMRPPLRAPARTLAEAVVSPAVPVAPAGAPAMAAVDGPAAGAGDLELLLDRKRQAEQRIQQLAAFLAAGAGATPLWNDPQIYDHAVHLRARIGARQGSQLQLSQTVWRLQPDNASLTAAYLCRGATGLAQGHIDVQLVWREGLWLVRSIDLAPSA